MLGPVLQNLEFLCQQCCSARVEERCVPLGAGAIDGLDGFEEVFHSIAVHIPLDFLSHSDHQVILHLPQPLLYKAVTSEEGCSGGTLVVQPDSRGLPRYCGRSPQAGQLWMMNDLVEFFQMWRQGEVL
ncbi:unnamed protein product [Schistocephalus solidus]|uniref:Secreted protein n=1 Tax=Schistocephalus solidus TaxID=70667 RepID=A0A183T4I0_SCHSO|nr:unnamed protein product [Schistocephalus solidus]